MCTKLKSIHRLTIGTHHGVDFWMNVEICGLFCGLITNGLIIYGMFVYTFILIKPWQGYSISGIFNMLIFNIAGVLAIISHFKAMTTDPGAVPRDALPLLNDEEELDYEISGKNLSTIASGSPRSDPQRQHAMPYKKYCRRCRCFKPSRAHHCSICNRCIVKMDHHCPWVNNCIGINNHKLFILFVFWTLFICLYAIGSIITKVFICAYSDNEEEYCQPRYSNGVFIVTLLVESILFGLFTLCILGDQLTVLTTNEAKIDRLKNLSQSSGSFEQRHLLSKPSESKGQSSLKESNSSYDLSANSSIKNYPVYIPMHNKLWFCWDCCIWNDWELSHSTLYKRDNDHNNSSLETLETGLSLKTLTGMKDDKDSDDIPSASESSPLHNYDEILTNIEEDDVNEVCGGSKRTKCRLRWFLPIQVKFPLGSLHDRIYGYRRRINPLGNEINESNQSLNHQNDYYDGHETQSLQNPLVHLNMNNNELKTDSIDGINNHSISETNIEQSEYKFTPGAGPNTQIPKNQTDISNVDRTTVKSGHVNGLSTSNDAWDENLNDNRSIRKRQGLIMV